MAKKAKSLKISKKLAALLSEAAEVKAPIALAKNPKPQKWHLSSLGQTYAPKKELVDLRTGRKISRGQARQIIRKYAKLNG